MAGSKVTRLKKIAREYHRHPKGAPNGIGGQFAPKNKAQSSKVPVIQSDIESIKQFTRIGSGVEGQIFADKKQGIVYKINHEFKERPNSRRNAFGKGNFSKKVSYEKESMRLKKANNLGIGPKLLSYDPSTNIMAMELIGDEYVTLKGMSKMDKPTKVKIISNMVSQMKNMHDGGMIHGDWHVGNVMSDTNGNIKIIDFGNSWSIDDDDKKLKKKSKYFISERLNELQNLLGDITYEFDEDEDESFFSNTLNSSQIKELKSLSQEINKSIDAIEKFSDNKIIPSSVSTSQFSDQIYSRIIKVLNQ
jgi:tRNA A-37 threonylcarbamoyl transferase component Bud32